MVEEDLSGLEVNDNLIANFHAHRRFVKAERAAQRAGLATHTMI